MSCEPSCRRTLVGIFIAVVCMLAASTNLRAQAGCNDCNAPDQVVPVNICLQGVNQIVNVTLCHMVFCPPLVYAHPCNPNNLPINARTVIKQICPTIPTGNIAGLVQATIAGLGICCDQGQFMTWCATAPNPNVFNWLVSHPVCWEMDAATGCWKGCNPSPCCTNLVRFTRLTTGGCRTTVLKTCDETGECPTSQCIRIPCTPYPLQCCIP